MVCVIGEALIDLVRGADVHEISAADGSLPYRAHPGGSPYNVAIGLARLGQHTLLQARFSDDAFGRQLRAHASDNEVDLSIAVAAAEPSTLAIVGIDEAGNASYDFYLNGTADWQWRPSELDRMPADQSWVHTGSLASWTQPSAAVIEAHLHRLRASRPVTISYDPNIRPRLMGEHQAAVDTVERFVALAHVVKASAEDLNWLYPGRDIAPVLRAWRDLGPAVVVVTDGGQGAHAIAASGEPITVPSRPVTVVDTVGAGDAFMAGLINALATSKALHTGLDHEALRAVIDEASTVAALTVAKAGANPPTATELAAELAG
ncbi:MAG TPA: carbohydrate kinase [Jatrophihabitans sp.]|jgi:fructokinase